jgi:MoxR-like ATPase
MPTDAEQFTAMLDACRTSVEGLFAEIGKAVVGQREAVRLVVAALLSRAHSLLVGVPGLAKTLLARTLAESLRMSFKRIQFTPDLLPSDITGTHVIDVDEETGKRTYRFLEGPVFANIVLADEINRAPPRTQAALLEAMEERQVSSGRETYRLPDPFFVVATQNPIEQEGTYPLPEAELDRFMLLVQLDYPPEEDEPQIIRSASAGSRGGVGPVLDSKQLRLMQDLVDRMPASDRVVRFASELARRTRPGNARAPDCVREYVQWGAGPRGGLFLVRGAKALAAIDGRPCPSIQDVRELAIPVLRHRIWMNFQAEGERWDTVRVVRAVLAETD